ncbi:MULTISPECIES: hypothetical protein [unclassified Sphingomonas]|uniref:hypothetical protein n=1 Tax=unclassified Sphingomonas TaxID=196159 RepID=UPI0012E0D507|nr:MULTISPECIES: hypothetical protein [unclassified Sphingomonas]
MIATPSRTAAFACSACLSAMKQAEQARRHQQHRAVRHREQTQAAAYRTEIDFAGDEVTIRDA